MSPSNLWNNAITGDRGSEQSRYIGSLLRDRCSTGPKPQPDAGHGMDETLARSVVAELATEAMHGDADDIACWGIVEAPDVPRQRRCRDDRVAVPHEVLEQTEFGARETRRHPVQVQRPFAGVEPERADLEDRLGVKCAVRTMIGSAALRRLRSASSSNPSQGRRLRSTTATTGSSFSKSSIAPAGSVAMSGTKPACSTMNARRSTRTCSSSTNRI